MNISVIRSSLQEKLQIICGVISTKTMLPILSNILIEAKGDKIQLTTTDLDIGITTTLDAEVREEGSTTVPAKRFMGIIRGLPEVKIEIVAKKNNIINISHKKSLFKVIGLPRDEFPKIPKIRDEGSISIKENVLKEMLTKTSFAISYDETRYILNGVLFEINAPNIRLVATDGRRLATVERKTEHKKDFKKSVVVPAKTINELNRLLKEDGEDEVKLVFTNNQILFDLKETLLISRLIEGKFPDYERVIPQETKRRIGVQREELLAAIKRVGLFTTQESQAIKIDLSPGKMNISKSTPDIGEAKEEISVDYKGEALSIGFNPNYLIDVLKSIKEPELNIELTGQGSPGVIKKEGYLYVVLPMQLT